jgi:beta-aspartyl-peptidase (threonine type)
MMTPQLEETYRKKLTEALTAGHRILAKGGTSLDAIEAAIRILEDSPLFNAGKGAVFTNAGTNELDASIMDGKTLNAGAVAGVKRIKNPISLARLVMTKSPHVLLSGAGAESFAKEQGIDWVDPKYFRTERRRRQMEERKKGTVGAVALDRHGSLAAGTSTGGMSNKRWGRIGDSAIVGAGTYADNETCAVSCTGHGEYFIRWAVAHDISAKMTYEGLSVERAAHKVVMEKLVKVGGSGGIIAIDARGNIAMPFNTNGMYRGFATADGKITVMMYR